MMPEKISRRRLSIAAPYSRWTLFSALQSLFLTSFKEEQWGVFLVAVHSTDDLTGTSRWNPMFKTTVEAVLFLWATSVSLSSEWNDWISLTAFLRGTAPCKYVSTRIRGLLVRGV